MTADSPRLGLTLAAGCRLRTDAADGPVLETPAGDQRLAPGPGKPGDRQIGALIARRLLAGGADEPSLASEVTAVGGYAGIRQLYGLIYALHERRVLGRTLATAAGPMLTGWPRNSRSPYVVGRVAGGPWRLSRFAVVRRVDDALMLESPLAPLRVTLHDARAGRLLQRLAEPCTAEELAAAVELDPGLARASLDLLGHFRLTVPVGEDGTTDEDRAPLRSWQHHDLLFHARSRFGTHTGGYGGTRRFGDGERPPPALASEPPTEATIELFRPDMEALREADPPLAQVIAERRSWRRHDGPPIDRRQLGELLYRTARVLEVDGDEIEVARRPYPGGGGSYELEVYPVIGSCEDLAPGLYRYLPAGHRLAPICETTPEVRKLLADAGHIGRLTGSVQVLLVLAARFRRVSWKYESMAYATILKDVGVVYQTVYLAATAMGLGACALGGGDADTFARAAGLDPYRQTSVGEMLLASRPG